MLAAAALPLAWTTAYVGVRTAQPTGARPAVRARAPLLAETETKPAFAFFQPKVPEEQQPVFELQNLHSQAGTPPASRCWRPQRGAAL